MEDLAVNKKFIDQLTGWTARTNLEKKLILGVMHKKNHKDMVEFEEAQSKRS